ncbi:endolytic transglycosylase MltG [Myceligenerans indicum]|uniref:Endolytic murein transglycosylase n=1 Tax=Myceligenerans indicum TaxID=2593663 RepID=A0ABS1LLS2_9MICO|nr:endolytic transglycosylase MltG [Myceligenerans indicum]MBL0887123.1 endolytic transglycosylase MltG [Myceligenerans indicum]
MALLLTAGALGAWTWKNDGYLFGYATPLAAQDYEGPGGEEVEVDIPEGANGATIGEVLLENDVVASYDAFKRAFDGNPDAPGIQPGIHVVRTQMSASEAVALLAENDIDRGGLTIPEGLTVKQIQDRIVAAGWPEKETRKVFEDLGQYLPEQAGGNPEGWLFPQTYDADPERTSPSDVVGMMTEMTVTQLEEAGVPQERWEDVLIRASLIEREAARPEDRPRMSGVIQRRLDEGWTLGIDAAVLYGTGRTSGALTRSELDDASNEYNLRIHKGLPPTPISNPGRASIDAAFHPAEGTEMYWVTVNHETGETKFATTNDEFNTLVAELRQWEADHPDWNG